MGDQINHDETKKALLAAETALEQALVRERELIEGQQRHISEVIHDIKNPLGAMMAYSSLMQGAGGQPLSVEQYVDYSKPLHKASEQLMQICESLLAVGKEDKNGQDGNSESDVQDVDVSELVGDIANLFNEKANQRGVKLDVDIEENFPKIRTAPTLLTRSLTNLMSNAMKFTKKGGRINIGAHMNKMEEAVLFVIRDSGVGIPPDQIMNILKPYHTTISPNLEKGTGLGLGIVNRLITELGGVMNITSKEAAGTTITLKFPKSMLMA